MHRPLSATPALVRPAGHATPTGPGIVRFPFLALAWVAIGLSSLAAFLLLSDRALVGGYATLVVTIPLLALSVTRVRWFHPLILVAIPAIIGLGMRSWYLLYADDRPGARPLLIGTDPVDTVVRGATVLGIGLSALTLGFTLRREQPLTPPVKPFWGNWTAPPGWTNLILLGSIAVGAIATVLYIRAGGGVSLDALSSKRYVQLEGGGVSSGAFVSRAAAVPAFAALAVVARLARGAAVPRSTRMLLGICLLISFVAPFIASSRSEIIAILVVITIAWTTRRPAVSLRLLPLGLVVLSLFLTMGAMRCAHQTGSEEGCTVTSQIEGSLLANESWMSVSKTAHIAAKVPDEVNFQYGRTLAAAIVAPIPRALWPEKPAVRADLLVAFEILELPVARRTGAPPGFVGELYLNLGWPGIVGGMFLLGWLLRRLWDWHWRNRSDFAVAVFAVLATHVALRLPAGDFVGSFLPAAQGLVILLFLMATGVIVGTRTGDGSVDSSRAQEAPS